MSPCLHHISEVPHQCNKLYVFSSSLVSHLPLTMPMLGCLGCGRHWSACKQNCSFFLPFSKGTGIFLWRKVFLLFFFFLILFDKAVFEVKVAVGRAVSPAETSFSHTDYIAMSVDQSLCIFFRISWTCFSALKLSGIETIKTDDELCVHKDVISINAGEIQTKEP